MDRLRRSVLCRQLRCLSPVRRVLWPTARTAGQCRTLAGGRRASTVRRLTVVPRRCLHSEENIVLMGSPGSGKTTVGKILSSMIDRPVVDVDNDHLEDYWNMPVSEKLTNVGAERFIEEEGKATLALQVKGHVVSLTGSNPMHKEAMKHIRQMGKVIFLDVPPEDIVNRLEQMKVSRIVGQGQGVPMSEILQYRQQFYEGNYHTRVICEPGEDAEGIANKVHSVLKRSGQGQGFRSTRGYQGSEDFNDVVLQGLAPDGGLFVIDADHPCLGKEQWRRLVQLRYPERAVRILEQWLQPADIHSSELAQMVEEAYTMDHFNCRKVFPVVPLRDGQFIHELFHGPTASFKDGALQLMPKFFHHALKAKGEASRERFLILVATSGDTGGAVLDGFAKLPRDAGVEVLVLYPEKDVSFIQKAQMTSAVGDNVRVVGVNSDFDFCQTSIKKIFTDKELLSKFYNKYNTKLSAANSINWGRLMPQVVYHASAYLDLVESGVISMGEEVDLCVPCGNFGNILAAYYSKRMGIPWRRLVCASNTNKILTDFIKTGRYDLTSRHLHQTTSPAIDILKPSNLERYLFHLSGQNGDLIKELYGQLDRENHFSIEPKMLEDLQRLFIADWCSEEDCKKTIHKVWQTSGYILDPHTAVAKTVADRLQDPAHPMVISATAHYGKFAHDVLPTLQGMGSPANRNKHPVELFKEIEAMDPKPRMHEALRVSMRRHRRHHLVCEGSFGAVVQQVEAFLDR